MTVNIELDPTKVEYMPLCSMENKKSNGEKEKGANPNLDPEVVLSALSLAKVAHKKAANAMEASKLTVTMAGAKLLSCIEMFSLTNKASQIRKNNKAQMTHTPWEDFYEELKPRLPPRLGAPSVSA